MSDEILSWPEVVARDDFRSLPDDQQDAVRTDYFEHVVKPVIAPEQIEQEKDLFDDYSIGTLTALRARREVDPSVYDTKLDAMQEIDFQNWRKSAPFKIKGDTHDLRGIFMESSKPEAQGVDPNQLLRRFEKPNSPTFSKDSVYAEQRPDLAGRWDGDFYDPPVATAGPWERKSRDVALSGASGLAGMGKMAFEIADMGNWIARNTPGQAVTKAALKKAGFGGMVDAYEDLQGKTDAAGEEWVARPIMDFLTRFQEAMHEEQSPELKEAKRKSGQILESDDHFLSKMARSAAHIVTDPEMAANVVAESGAFTYGAGKIIGAFSKAAEAKAMQTAIKEAMARGTPKAQAIEIAKEAAKKAAEAAAVTAAVGTNAILEGASAADQARTEVLSAPDAAFIGTPEHERIMGPPAQRRTLDDAARKERMEQVKVAVADRAAKAAFMVAAPIAGVATKLTSGGIDVPLFGPGGKGVRSTAVAGLVKEPVEESLQGAGGQLASNVAAQQTIAPEQDISAGVDVAMGEGAGAGVAFGAPGAVVALGRDAINVRRKPANPPSWATPPGGNQPPPPPPGPESPGGSPPSSGASGAEPPKSGVSVTETPVPDSPAPELPPDEKAELSIGRDLARASNEAEDALETARKSGSPEERVKAEIANAEATIALAQHYKARAARMGRQTETYDELIAEQQQIIDQFKPMAPGAVTSEVPVAATQQNVAPQQDSTQAAIIENQPAQEVPTAGKTKGGKKALSQEEKDARKLRQSLTAKQRQQERRKPKTDDDLITLIAKWGGWDYDDAMSHGVEPGAASLGPRGMPGISFLSKKGGKRRSLGGLAEKMYDEGFDIAHDQGIGAGYDDNKALDLIRRAIAGESIYSRDGAAMRAAEDDGRYEEDDYYSAPAGDGRAVADTLESVFDELGLTEQEVETLADRAQQEEWENEDIIEAAYQTVEERGDQDRARDLPGQEEVGQEAEAPLLETVTPEELRRRDEAQQKREREETDADAKAQADKDRDQFALTGSDREADTAAAAGQQDLLSQRTPVSPELEAASEKHKQASQKFAEAQRRYRAREIDDKEFLAAKKAYEVAGKEYDKAMDGEASRQRDTEAATTGASERVRAARAIEDETRRKSQWRRLFKSDADRAEAISEMSAADVEAHVKMAGAVPEGTVPPSLLKALADRAEVAEAEDAEKRRKEKELADRIRADEEAEREKKEAEAKRKAEEESVEGKRKAMDKKVDKLMSNPALGNIKVEVKIVTESGREGTVTEDAMAALQDVEQRLTLLEQIKGCLNA